MGWAVSVEGRRVREIVLGGKRAQSAIVKKARVHFSKRAQQGYRKSVRDAED